MRVGVFVASGETNFKSSLSSTARLIEEVKVDKVIIFHTDSSKNYANILKDKLERLSERAGTIIEVETIGIPGDKEPLELRLEALKRYEGEADIALISPAGASLASIASRVFKRVAHVSFPFGYWSDLTYPFVLRQFQRVDVTPHDVERGGINASDFEGLASGGRIRSKVAEIVRKINKEVKKPCLNNACEDVELRVSIRYNEGMKSKEILEMKVREDVKIDERVKEAKKKLKEIEGTLQKRKKIYVGGLDSLIWLSGLFKTAPDPHVESNKSLILDTSAILLGALNWRFKNLKVRVPRCALYELIHKYEESVKPKKGKFDLVGLLGKALVDEVKHLGLLYPSNPDFCDKALLQMDPYLLYNTYVVTADRGIKMMWDESPLEKLAPIVMVKKVEEVDDSFPNVVYSVIQLFVLFKIIEEELRSVKGFLKEKFGEEWSESVTFAGELYADDKRVEGFVISL